jgi:hypothetical protein
MRGMSAPVCLADTSRLCEPPTPPMRGVGLLADFAGIAGQSLHTVPEPAPLSTRPFMYAMLDTLPPELLRAALESAESRPARRAGSYPRSHTKRQPIREQYATEDAYVEAWTLWRQLRDNNNESVRRFRERGRSTLTQTRVDLQVAPSIARYAPTPQGLLVESVAAPATTEDDRRQRPPSGEPDSSRDSPAKPADQSDKGGD